MSTALNISPPLYRHINVASVSMSTWYMILTILILKQMGCIKLRKLNITVSILIRNVTLAQMISFALAFLCAGIWNNTLGSMNIINSMIIFGAFALFQTIGSTFNYLFLIYRLRLAFKDSSYAVSNMIVYSHYALLILINMLCIIGYVSFVCQWYIPFIIFVCAAVILYGFGFVHITYLFHIKLFELVLSQRKTILRRSTNTSENGREDDIELNERQLKMIEMITKHYLLQMISIIAFIPSLGIPIIISCIAMNQGLCVFVYSLSIGLVIASFNNYLTFTMNDGCYRMIYGNCHLWTSKRCVELASKETMQRVESEKSLEQEQKGIMQV